MLTQYVPGCDSSIFTTFSIIFHNTGKALYELSLEAFVDVTYNPRSQNVFVRRPEVESQHMIQANLRPFLASLRPVLK